MIALQNVSYTQILILKIRKKCISTLLKTAALDSFHIYPKQSKLKAKSFLSSLNLYKLTTLNYFLIDKHVKNQTKQLKKY